METLIKDIRYGLRGLLKRPAFTIVAVITLALGIGANTAIFTLIDAVLLKQLPVSRPEELVLFNDAPGEGTRTTDGDPSTGRWRYFSYFAYRYFRDHNRSFTELSAFRSGEMRLSIRRMDDGAGETTQRASGHLVSGNYFAVLSVNASQGRVLTNEDDQLGAPPATVISNGYWKERLGSDAHVVGKSVLLNGTAFTIVGVMPPEFFGVRVRRSPDFWLPLVFQPQIELRQSFLDDKNVYWLNLIGRLKPGITLSQAQANVTAELRDFLTDQAGTKLTDDRRRGIQNTWVQLDSGARGISGLRNFYSQALRLLLAIVFMVLLIACANVGNLLLSRSVARQTEFSLRQALGASRVRLIRQLLTESLLLAVIGGVAGIALAQWGVSFLVMRVAATAPLDVKPNLRLLLFTLGLSLASGMLFGLAPALRAVRADLNAALKEKASQARKGRLGLASLLVISQVTVSLMLLVGAGLFARSLLKLQQEDLGFNRDNVFLTSVDARLAGYKPAELTALYRQLYDRLSALPNVRSATLASTSPMSGSSTTSSVLVRGYTARPGEDMVVGDMLVGPNYSETLGLPLLLGRDIGLQDTPASTRVAVINQSFAQAYFPGQNPIGRRITFEENSDKDDLEIVGVLGDAKYSSAKEKANPTVYRPILQVQDQFTYPNVLELRTAGEPLGVAAEAKAAIAQIDPKLPLGALTSLRIQTDEALSQERLMAQLVSFFGLLALGLACIGLYGLMAHAVARRTNEIGIRMALGAKRRDIIRMVLKETMITVVIGIGIGVPAALGAGRLISSQIFGLSPSDPATVVTAVLLLTSVAAFAGYLPARRAARVDPLVALRYE